MKDCQQCININFTEEGVMVEKDIFRNITM